MMMSGLIHQAAFPDSDESQAILSPPGWFSIPSTAERGWRYLNHPENAPSVTSKLLVGKKKKKKKSARPIWAQTSVLRFGPHTFLVGTVGFFWLPALTFLFPFGISLMPSLSSASVGGEQQRGQRELVQGTNFCLYIFWWEEAAIVRSHSSVSSWEINSN